MQEYHYESGKYHPESKSGSFQPHGYVQYAAEYPLQDLSFWQFLRHQALVLNSLQNDEIPTSADNDNNVQVRHLHAGQVHKNAHTNVLLQRLQ